MAIATCSCHLRLSQQVDADWLVKVLRASNAPNLGVSNAAQPRQYAYKTTRLAIFRR